jgi:ariadne-1
MNMEASFMLPSKGKRKSYEIEYHSLSQEAVDKLAQQDVDHISGIFGVDVSLFFDKTDSFF